MKNIAWLIKVWIMGTGNVTVCGNNNNGTRV
jgi:hypothetical protein